MSVQQRQRRHGKGKQTPKQRVQCDFEEARGGMGVVEVETVAVEFGHGGGCDEEAWWVPKGEDVEGVQECGEKGGCEAVVGWGGEG